MIYGSKFMSILFSELDNEVLSHWKEIDSQ